MSIKFKLLKNHLTGNNNDYYARVIQSNSIDLERIADTIIEQSNTTVGKADMMAVFIELLKTCRWFMEEGYHINMGGLFEMYPTIGGKFDGEDDTYDPARHKIDIITNTGKKLRKQFQTNAVVEKVIEPLRSPQITSFTDVDTALKNMQVSSNGIGTLLGKELKFDSGQVDEGVFLVDSIDSSEFEKITIFQHQGPTKIVFKTPNVPFTSGEAYFEVRSRMGSVIGEVRTNRLSYKLNQV